jgi:DNA-directed RNA polymerase specialized sigma subunit
MVEHMQAKERLERTKNINTIRLLLESDKREITFWDSMVSKVNQLTGCDSLAVKMTEFRDSMVKDAESLTTETRFMVDLVKGLKDVRQQKVIAGHYFQEKPFSQVASDTGLSLSTVRRLHSAALAQLDKMLLNEGAVS